MSKFSTVAFLIEASKRAMGSTDVSVNWIVEPGASARRPRRRLRGAGSSSCGVFAALPSSSDSGSEKAVIS